MRPPRARRGSLVAFGTVSLLLIGWASSQQGTDDGNATAAQSDGSSGADTTAINNTCLVASDRTGCSFPSCQEWVCGQYDSCCEIAWTDTCVVTAMENPSLCFFVPPSRENNCFSTDPFLRPGCADATCEAVVCGQAPACCETSYSAACVEIAVADCGLSSVATNRNSCFERSLDDNPGCSDAGCLRAVCAVDSSCCGISYTSACVETARALGEASCAPVEYNNTCLDTSPVGGCSDKGCEQVVCDVLPGCCDSAEQTGQYGDNCVAIASQSCQLYTELPSHSCFETSSRPGCEDHVCLEQVCLLNDFCCSDSYNQTCVQTARRNGLSCAPPPVANSCLVPSPFGGCTNEVCQQIVCTERPTCCSDGNLVGEWSTECADLARSACTVAGLNTCFQNVKTPGCSDSDCAAFVCEMDDFCCARQWDSSCVAIATEHLDECPNGWPDQANSCFEADPFERPGCDGPVCETTVCSLRPQCCNVGYDASCVDEALRVCELPEPENLCFDTSGVPGCTDGQCLDVVCEIDATCCTAGYSTACVDLARRNAIACPPPHTNNSCFEESRFGGCTDVRCQELVCEISSTCCNTDVVGEWSDVCVRAASEVCQPKVLPRPPGDCPFGMTCDLEFMSNCTELVAQYVEIFDLGEIYGGVYCAEGEGLVNCPVGSYCPDPETLLPCPAGFYCPYKTSHPAIECQKCDEGATTLTQDPYGWIVLGIVISFVVLYIGFTLLQQHNNGLAHRLQELEKRVLASAHSNMRFSSLYYQSQKKNMLEKLRPKLELVSRRLFKLEEMNSANDSVGSATRHGRKTNGVEIGGEVIKFDARRVFDLLDADASGDVTFKELNVILGLNDLELKEFIRRMNEMAGSQSNNTSVTRPVFVKYFLQVLTETTHLTISFEEAEALFDEMAGGAKDKPANEINMNKFYASSMSEFLSESQIFDLIKRFKALKGSNVLHNSGSAVASRRSTVWKLSNSILDGRKSTAPFGIPLPSALVQMRRPSAASRSITSRQPSATSLGADGRVTFRHPSVTSFGADESVTMGNHRSSAISASSGGQRGPPPAQNTIGRDEFIEHYPQLLLDFMLEDEDEDDIGDKMEQQGIDMCFKNLSLSIKLGKNSVKVVDDVTGRIRAKSMTAIMGGSGAGKTSLLNALCGRAYYGETTGSILVNGHEESIEDHKDSVGFVPQDDIVYAELTVRENLIFSGRFRLPIGTSNEDIEELADETLASLGLARVADSLVGDVRRRGVSGGEKKRVNIGLELMALPSILFLDEPTSGLDASSALLVMKSLKQLAEKDGVTVVSVIHQPRKFIFDLFDSLILLGVGGRMVYHGRTRDAESYFARLNYFLPEGESMADWLIDISSGRLEPDSNIASNKKVERLRLYKQVNQGRMKKLNIPSFRSVDTSMDGTKPDCTVESSGGKSIQTGDDETAGTSSSREIGGDSEDGKEKPLPRTTMKSFILASSSDEEEREAEAGGDPEMAALMSSTIGPTTGQVVTDGNCVGARGVTTGKVAQAFEEAKVRRACLYDEWMKHMQNLTPDQKAIYEPPEKYDLPFLVQKPLFRFQFVNQLRRAVLVAWRNRFSKIVDCTIIVGSVVVITALDGTTEVSVDENPDIDYDVMVRPLADDIYDIFQRLFAYAVTRQIQYPLKVGIIMCVLLGLTATKIVTSKRLEFFRESGSGYNLNAYFFAVSILSTVEHSLQVVIAAFFASWIRNPIASNASYYVHFLFLAWVTVAWALLIPMVFPADSVTLVAGFFFAFFGLMFSGAFAPIQYDEIYAEGGFKEVFAGWMSPTRFFYEALAVGEYRCLPEQSGFTIQETSINRATNSSLMILFGYAGHDYNAVRYSCSGWYWSVLPSFFVGLTVRYLAIGAMHTFFRGQQTKKPLWKVMRKNGRVTKIVVAYLLVFAGLVVFTTWSFTRDVPFDEPEPLTRAQILDKYGFFD